MATVTKDFRVKSGLIVEGANGTIDGSDIITADKITGGTNVGVTVSYVDGAVNFEVEASEAVTELAQDAVAEAIAAGTHSNITITYDDVANTFSFAAENGVADSDTDDLAEGITNLYFTNQRALDATASAYDAAGSAAQALSDANDYTDTVVGAIPSAVLSIAGDTGTDSVTLVSDTLTFAGDANLDVSVTDNTITVSSNATSDPTMDTIVLRGNDGEGSSLIKSDVFVATNGVSIRGTQIGSGSGGLVIYDDTSNIYQNGTFSGSLNVNNGTITNLSEPTNAQDAATKNYVDSAVAGIVDGAPALLDTLNELAAAIGDDENYATTVAGLIADKQNTLTAGDNISIVSDTISVTGLDSTDISDFNTAALSATASAYDVAGAAATAEQNAKDYTDAEVGLRSYLDVSADNGPTQTQIGSQALVISGGVGITTTSTTSQVTIDIDSDVVTLTGSQTLSNKTLGSDLDVNYNNLNNVGTIGAGNINANGVYISSLDVNNGALNVYDNVVSVTGDIFFGGELGLGGSGKISNLEDPTSAQDAATKNYVDTELDGYLNSTSGSEGTTILYVQDYVATAIETGDATATPTYLAVDINSIATQVAATATTTGGSAEVVYEFSDSFRAAKFLVKLARGTHTEVSEVLLTLDTGNNIAITEYAVVGTNGSLGTISATYNGITELVQLTVDTPSATTVKVAGTLLA